MVKKIIEEHFLACKKHPVFANSMESALAILMEEVGEIARAIQEKDTENIKTEIAQAAAVCIRMLDLVENDVIVGKVVASKAKEKKIIVEDINNIFWEIDRFSANRIVDENYVEFSSMDAKRVID